MLFRLALGFSPELAAPGAGYQIAAAPVMECNASPGEAIGAGEPAGGWRLIRGAQPVAEHSAAAILHTADFERSDPRLAGLMLQCGVLVEAIIVVVEPFPPHAKPQVTLRTPDQESHFTGKIIRPARVSGCQVTRLTLWRTGGGRKARELELTVTEGDAAISGVVDLTGLPKALEWLSAECMQK